MVSTQNNNNYSIFLFIILHKISPIRKTHREACQKNSIMRDQK